MRSTDRLCGYTPLDIHEDKNSNYYSSQSNKRTPDRVSFSCSCRKFTQSITDYRHRAHYFLFTCCRFDEGNSELEYMIPVPNRFESALVASLTFRCHYQKGKSTATLLLPQIPGLVKATRLFEMMHLDYAWTASTAFALAITMWRPQFEWDWKRWNPPTLRVTANTEGKLSYAACLGATSTTCTTKQFAFHVNANSLYSSIYIDKF